jgi:hypothetical protein
LETRNENICSENPSKPNLINAVKLHAKVKLRMVKSSRSASREERKREASKPLYLDRYE